LRGGLAVSPRSRFRSSPRPEQERGEKNNGFQALGVLARTLLRPGRLSVAASFVWVDIAKTLTTLQHQPIVKINAARAGGSLWPVFRSHDRKGRRIPDFRPVLERH
jgi:hypothetical protein